MDENVGGTFSGTSRSRAQSVSNFSESEGLNSVTSSPLHVWRSASSLIRLKTKNQRRKNKRH